jgi:hypothetical protein
MDEPTTSSPLVVTIGDGLIVKDIGKANGHEVLVAMEELDGR